MRVYRLRNWLQRCALAALTLVPNLSAFANGETISCHGDRKMCETVTAGERELTSMMTSGDAGIISRLFADDAIWSLGDGTRRSKGDAIAALRKGRKMASSQLLQADVRQFGTTAIVTWKESWRAPGASHDEVSFGTDTWLLRGRRWRIIASQEAHVPAK